MSIPRVLMIGLDAADPELIDRWIDDGTLPRLGALRRSGAHGRLRTPARYLAGSPWPTFYTGRPPTHHGIYHDFQWRHERMEFARPTHAWLPATPFWREIEGDVDTVAYDVPMTTRCEPFRGTEITGWASHDKLGPACGWPEGLLDEVRGRFGAWPVRPESYGRSSIDELLGLRDEMVANTRRSAELVEWLLRRPWRLAIAVFAALHRGGHRLWDRSSLEGDVPPERGEEFDGALRELYVECDRAVGRLVEAAPGATVIVFSLHGMMANTCRADLLDGMLARVLGGADSGERRPGLVRRLGEALPVGMRRALTSIVPSGLRDRAMTLWQAGGIDWATTEAFTLRADLHGYVRVNLAGREPEGIVGTGDYDALCGRIAEGLATFRDATTGETVVAEVRRVEDLFGDGPRRDRLPDLVVRWTDTSAAAHVALVSDRFGRVERATPGRIPNGRSANHRGEGFWIATGPGVAPGVRAGEPADVEDLAPTALARIGARVKRPLAGSALPALAP